MFSSSKVNRVFWYFYIKFLNKKETHDLPYTVYSGTRPWLPWATGRSSPPAAPSSRRPAAGWPSSRSSGCSAVSHSGRFVRAQFCARCVCFPFWTGLADPRSQRRRWTLRQKGLQWYLKNIIQFYNIKRIILN